jgi:phosphotransferase system enzyme I (PtsI)
MSKRKTGKSSGKSRSVKPKRRTPSKRRRGADGPSVDGIVAGTSPVAATGIRPKARAVIRGIGVSPGVVVGQACCLHETTISLETAEELGEERVLAELARYNEAREKALSDLRAAHQKVATHIGHHEAAIFSSHTAILGDESFSNQVSRYILEKQQTAEAALQTVLNDYEPVFASIKSEYLKERMADLRDITRRLQKHLSDTPGILPDRTSGVLVVDELLPSDLIPVDNWDITGIITQTGGRTSHAAILARSRGIPAVSGIPRLFDRLQSGDTVIVDGHEGIVFVGPDRETEHAYQKIQREYLHLKDKLVANRDRPAISADRQPVELLANVNSLADAQMATRVGTAGIGLFRTEYLFLAHPDIPDEEEQLKVYQAVIAASPGRVVTIRTLDLGGDKILPLLGYANEANPFMGWRSIRLSFEYPEFFVCQIRAILRAATHNEKQVRLLLPMITTRSEILNVRRMVAQAQRSLEREHLSYGQTQLGIMVEVPAAAIAIDTLLDIVDFVSIGSNDLVQYLTAADRGNPKVAHLCEPLSPAVLRLLNTVVEACTRVGKPVSLCGEMASSPRALPLLFGMGFRSLSMSPAFVPAIKELLSHLTVERAERALKRTLQMKNPCDVIRFMDRELADVCPSLTVMATS